MTRIGAGALLFTALSIAGAAAAEAPAPNTPMPVDPSSLRYSGEPKAKVRTAGTQSDVLARGGTSVLPEYRPVGFYGAPQSDGFGELGIGSPQSAARRLKEQIRPYAGLSDKPIYPLFELIGTIALSSPGPDGLYRGRQPNGVIRRYAQEAKESRLLLMLDIQPGRADPMDEVKYLEPWLRKPFVSVALDPEWEMGPGQVPGQTIGHTSAGEVNDITAYLNKLAREDNLPDKVFLVHQFTSDMIHNSSKLKERGRVDMVLNADGVGSRSAKTAQYQALSPPKSSPFFPGFKLFYEEDSGLMSPSQVMGLRPRPSVIAYE
jgi:hypothetical protein